MLVDTYGTHYQEKFHEAAPILWPRDMAIAAKLLKQYVFAKLSEWVRAFIWSEDRQIVEGGKTFPQFQYHLSKIITASHQGHSKTVKLLKGIYYDEQRTPVRDAVAFLAVSFNKMDMEPPQTRSYERALVELADRGDLLQKAVELLIDEAANGRQFYPMPKPSDLKGACAKVIEVMRLKAFADAAHVCDHQPRFFEEVTREDGSTELRRCSHYRAGKLAMEAVKKLALPASSEFGSFQDSHGDAA